MASPSPATASSSIKVWDGFVRIFHWLLVACVAFAWWCGEQGGEWMVWHMRCGYTVLGLVIFRLVWGFAGPFYARFAQFVRSPTTVLHYGRELIKRREPHYVGHNPVGGWAVILLLMFCALQAGTGLFANDEIFNEGPLAHWVDYDLSVAITEWHEILFNGLLAVVAVHVLGVFYHQVIRRENLISAMLHGKKPAADAVDAAPATAPKVRNGLGIVVAVVAGLLVWGLISL
ncbi:cytochrome b/b6 domain-containing protein [Spongiibacter tropicus]|uniref:cytochrome b/b6 domain-containing protein n=1 Tax=Spongiibacter tropicus TaxID=454602 RepID=UPI0035BE6A7F